MTSSKLIPLIFILSAWISPGISQDKTISWGAWEKWGDQRNGTYRNPILPADYSDLDCIRVGADYYAISSTFQYSPGMVILHSKDLVNWEISGHAVNDLTRISPEMNWERMNRYGKGIWAGAIRYHANKFWIYFGTPDEGYFMTSAENVKGPWAPLHQVLAEKGWDDCCPFWDDDGQGYLVGSNFSDGYKIHMFKLSEDGKSILRETDKVIYQSRGSEANKLYKINGIYYHFFSEVRTGGRAVMMERSNTIWGPYKEIKQLSHPQKQFNEPNQGGIVQTQKGDWYFLTHHGTGDWSGRIMSLLPVTWVAGWPVLGAVGADTIGTMAWEGIMPLKSKPVKYKTSDEFSSGTLPVQWEWNYQPRDDKWSLKERRGWLRLHAFQPIKADNLLTAGNTLTQRVLRTPGNEVTVKLDLKGMQNGQRAGLTHFGSPNYSSLGVSCEKNEKKLVFKVKDRQLEGAVLGSDLLWLRSTWQLNGLSRYEYSTDGKIFLSFGEPYQMMWGSYRGDRIGIYCYTNGQGGGFVDVDFFRYNYR